MNKMILMSLLLGLAGPVAATDLQMARIQPSFDVSRHDRQMAALAPSLRAWVSARSRVAVDSGVAPEPALLAREVRARLAGQDFSTMDVDALVQLVMMESARQADADLREMTAQMKANNQRKAEMRELTKARRAAVATAAPPTATASPEAQAICVDPPCRPQLTSAQPQIDLAKQPTADSARPIMPTDSVSEMSEMESLRLQMAMDRMSKLMSTLSNVLKKTSDTNSAITSNLK
jgi:hypothetical protein